jgi:hypothetical protein
MSDPLPENMKSAADVTRRLNGLFEDPHPGLITWMQAVIRLSSELYVELHKVGIGDTILVKAKVEEINKEFLVEEIMNS